MRGIIFINPSFEVPHNSYSFYSNKPYPTRHLRNIHCLISQKNIMLSIQEQAVVIHQSCQCDEERAVHDCV